MIEGTTHRPTIIKNDASKYVIIGSVDHGMEIPQSSVPELIASLADVDALVMETPEEFHTLMQPLSTELLVKASVGRSPIHYLSGNKINEEIGELVLKYAPQCIAEVFVPCIYVRNSCQLGQEVTFESVAAFTTAYRERFGFIDVERIMRRYMQVLQHWDTHKLSMDDLDDFSYDFEKFVGDVREFELWQPELIVFRGTYQGNVAVCVGGYHVPFVQAVFDGHEIQAPNWETHIDSRREDRLSPQDAGFLRNVYANLEEALRG